MSGKCQGILNRPKCGNPVLVNAPQAFIFALSSFLVCTSNGLYEVMLMNLRVLLKMAMYEKRLFIQDSRIWTYRYIISWS